MLKRIKIIDEATKQVLTMSANSNEVWAISNGYSVELFEVEIGYDNNYYLQGYALNQPFEELKANKLTEINNSYTTEANVVRATTPEDEVLTWDIQKLEAQAWELDNTVATPFCTTLAEAREMDREVLLNKVLEKVYGYQTLMAGLTGKRQKIEDQLDAIIDDTEENRAIIEGLSW